MQMTHRNHASRCRLALATLALAALVPSALAGTFSVIGVEWYPTTAPGTATDGGYIQFKGNDILYGFNATGTPGDVRPVVAQAPNQGTAVYLDATVEGTWRWKVRWVGAAGETPPGEDTPALVEYKGSGTVGAYAIATSPYSSSVQVQMNDPYAFLYAATAGTSTGSYSGNSSGPIATFTAEGAGTWSLESGTTNTCDGEILITVNDLVAINCNGQLTPSGGQGSGSQGSAVLSITVRLTSVGGQQVQSKL